MAERHEAVLGRTGVSKRNRLASARLGIAERRSMVVLDDRRDIEKLEGGAMSVLESRAVHSNLRGTRVLEPFALKESLHGLIARRRQEAERRRSLAGFDQPGKERMLHASLKHAARKHER